MNAQEALRDQAARDPLTGIWNRNAIFDIFRRELSRAERAGHQLAIHARHRSLRGPEQYVRPHGRDAVLREFTSRIATSLRPYDSVGRYGGEEFLVVLPECDLDGGKRHAERLRALITDDPFDTSEGRHTVTCSLGVASSLSPDLKDTDSLIRAADAALYRAKRGGRNRVEA